MLYAFFDNAVKVGHPLAKAVVGDNSGNHVAEYIAGQHSKESLLAASPWLASSKLVAKPDQLVKRRGKHGLVCINRDLDGALEWIGTKAQT